MPPLDSATWALVPEIEVLDDLELLRNGVLGADLVGPTELVSVPLPDPKGVQNTTGAVRIEDHEGVPIAVVPLQIDEQGAPVIQGRPSWVQRRSARPYEHLHVPPTEVPDPATVVVVDGSADLSVVADDGAPGPVLILALASTDGEGSPLAFSAVRTAQVWVAQRADARVVVVPLGPRARRRREKIGRVLTAYAPAATVVDLTRGEQRPEVDGSGGIVVFFTGLSGSGKSTVARQVRNWLIETGQTVTFLDGDLVRRHLSAGLGFSREDRDRNILRIGWVAAEVAAHGGIAICSPIAPFENTREQVRAQVRNRGGRFVLIHVATPLAECERRDRKGLYARARRGEIPDFTGVSSPYEEPTDPDLRIDTTGADVRALRDQVLAVLGYDSEEGDRR